MKETIHQKEKRGIEINVETIIFCLLSFHEIEREEQRADEHQKKIINADFAIIPREFKRECFHFSTREYAHTFNAAMINCPNANRTMPAAAKYSHII